MKSTRKTPPQGDERYRVPNLDRALQIIEYLADQTRAHGITDIAAALKMPKNSVFRILTTLHARGYVTRDPAKQYTLTGRLLSLGYAAVSGGHLVEKSIDVMRQVRDKVDETVFIGVIEGCEGVVLEQVECHQQVKVVVGIGTRFPLHTAAPAKAMLAHMPEPERADLLEKLQLRKFTANTLTTLAALRAELDQAVTRGYAVDNCEHNEGIRCVGAAILNQSERPVGAIWVVGPSFRLQTSDFQRIGRIVRDGALTISRRFGYGGVDLRLAEA